MNTLNLPKVPDSTVIKNPSANAGDVKDVGLTPGLGRSPGEGNGSPLQHSCLENPVDGGAWWATVHGAVKSRPRLSDFTSLPFTLLYCCQPSSYFPRHHPDLCSGFSTSVAGRIVPLPKDVHALTPGAYIYLLYMARGNVGSRRLLIS